MDCWLFAFVGVVVRGFVLLLGLSVWFCFVVDMVWVLCGRCLVCVGILCI